jgi:hypothetical protein
MKSRIDFYPKHHDAEIKAQFTPFTKSTTNLAEPKVSMSPTKKKI